MNAATLSKNLTPSRILTAVHSASLGVSPRVSRNV
jgi:hypothetical protein